MTRPRATYRVQFRGGVGFREALLAVPYLDRLGVSHLYASPLLQARRGSTHGYDVVDPTRLIPSWRRAATSTGWWTGCECAGWG